MKPLSIFLLFLSLLVSLVLSVLSNMAAELWTIDSKQEKLVVAAAFIFFSALSVVVAALQVFQDKLYSYWKSFQEKLSLWKFVFVSNLITVIAVILLKEYLLWFSISITFVTFVALLVERVNISRKKRIPNRYFRSPYD